MTPLLWAAYGRLRTERFLGTCERLRLQYIMWAWGLGLLVQSNDRVTSVAKREMTVGGALNPPLRRGVTGVIVVVEDVLPG